MVQAQEQLETLGIDPGPIDGFIGPKTREALRAFQRQSGLAETGELDAPTLGALASVASTGSAADDRSDSTGQPSQEAAPAVLPGRGEQDPNRAETSGTAPPPLTEPGEEPTTSVEPARADSSGIGSQQPSAAQGAGESAESAFSEAHLAEPAAPSADSGEDARAPEPQNRAVIAEASASTPDGAMLSHGWLWVVVAALAFVGLRRLAERSPREPRRSSSGPDVATAEVPDRRPLIRVASILPWRSSRRPAEETPPADGLQRRPPRPRAATRRGVRDIAAIIGFFRALFQLRDPRFRRVLLRSVVYSAMLVLGFGICAGWLVMLLPETVALPLIGKLTVPLVGEVAVPLVGEVAVPLRQVEVMSIPLLVMVSSLLMFPAAGAVAYLMLDDIVDVVEARHYPHLPELRASARTEMIAGAGAFALLVLTVNLGALVFYVVAGALAPLVFWVVNGFLIAREFFSLVAGRRLPADRVAALRWEHGWRIWLGGCLIAVPLSLPLIGLVIPVLGTAMFTHMLYQFWRPEADSESRAGEQREPEPLAA